MNNTKKIYMPLFTGFYDTIHSLNYEGVIEYFIQSVNDNDNLYSEKLTDKERAQVKKGYCEADEVFCKYWDVNYMEYEKDYSIEYYDVFVNEFSGLGNKIGINIISYEGIYSPKYYNFDTDSINIGIEYDMGRVKKYLLENKGAFSKYINKQNTSCDGFIAYGENDFKKYISKEDFEAFELTQVIDFYIYEYKKSIGAECTDLNLEFYYNAIGKINIYSYIESIVK